jgi:YidC/Oxa1 family membrane protein insertase
MLAFLDPAVSVLSHVVTTVGDVLQPVLGDAATAGAIVLVTIAVRLILVPLSYRAAKATKARLAMRPKEQELRKQLQHQPQRLNKELNDLRQQHQTSKFAGILPLLAQAPVFMVMYRLFLSPTVNGQANVLLTHTLLGVPLGDKWLADLATGLLPPDLLVFGALFVLLAAVAWWSSRQARQAQEVMALTPTTLPDTVSPELARSMESMQGMMGTLSRLAPFGTVVAAAFVPLAAALYLLTTTAWSVAERHVFGTYRTPALAR